MGCTDVKALNILDKQITRVLKDNLPRLSEYPIEKKKIEYAQELADLVRDQARIKDLQAELKAMLGALEALNNAGVEVVSDSEYESLHHQQDDLSDKCEQQELKDFETYSQKITHAAENTFLEGRLTVIEASFNNDNGKCRFDLQCDDPTGNCVIIQYREHENGASMTLKKGATEQQIRAFVESIPIAFEDFIEPTRSTALAFCQHHSLKGLDKKTLKTIFDGMPRVTLSLDSGFDQAFYENRIRQLLSHGILPELGDECQCKELADAHKAVLMADGEWNLQEICKYYICQHRLKFAPGPTHEKRG